MSTAPATANLAVWCTELELSAGVSRLTAPDGVSAEARVLLRLHGESLGFVQLPIAGGFLSRQDLITALPASARQKLTEHLEADGATSSLPDLDTGDFLPFGCRRGPVAGPLVSVVVCTRNRGPALRDCLQQLQQLTYSPLEVVIVDNAPSDNSTRQIFDAVAGADPRFSYVLEPRKGLSRARNRGLAAARGELIAYTDDDVRVDTDWVSALVRVFAADPVVGCVTSLVCTAELNTPAEHYFDGKVSWATSCDTRFYALDTPSTDPLYPYAPGLFGTGAGMGFRTRQLRELGGFDEALGAGTRTAGGEDLDIFVRVLQAGHTLVYEPSSVVWHHHRSDYAGLRRQMFGYGSGLTAYVTKHLLDRRSRGELMRRIPRGVAHMTSVARKSQSSAAAGTPLPTRALLIRELAGMAAGPLLYAAARRDVVTGRTSAAPVIPARSGSERAKAA